MKKLLIIALVMGIVIPAMSQEEKKYTMYEMTYLKPRLDKMKELGEAMAKHNKTFHNEGPYKAHVWMANTGPHTGDWIWVMGPCTFTDLDNRPDSKEHMEDWLYNVLPYVEEVSEGEYWKLNDELSYAPEGSFSGNEIWTVYDIKDWQKYRFKELLKKVTEVYKEKAYPNYFEVYESQFDGNPQRDIAVGFGFKNFAFFDEDRKFKNDYEEVHGEGSWAKAMEEYRDIVIGAVDELSEYIPELSGGEDKE